MKKLIAVVLALALCITAPVRIHADEVEDPMEPTEELTETEVIEETEPSVDTEILQTIAPYVIAICEYAEVMCGCFVALIVVVLCFFAYKFLRIFF